MDPHSQISLNAATLGPSNLQVPPSPETSKTSPFTEKPVLPVPFKGLLHDNQSSAALSALPVPDRATLGNAHLVKELPDVVVLPPTSQEGNDPFCVWSAQDEGIVRSFLDSNPPTPVRRHDTIHSLPTLLHKV